MKVNIICDAVRGVLESKDSKKYLQSIITTYVKKSPPELESALNFLAKLKGNNKIDKIYFLPTYLSIYLIYSVLYYKSFRSKLKSCRGCSKVCNIFSGCR